MHNSISMYAYVMYQISAFTPYFPAKTSGAIQFAVPTGPVLVLAAVERLLNCLDKPKSDSFMLSFSSNKMFEPATYVDITLVVILSKLWYVVKLYTERKFRIGLMYILTSLKFFFLFHFT